MSNGIPLDDADRKPWLEALSVWIAGQEKGRGAVLAFSGLKETYRAVLSSSCSEELVWIFLSAPKSVLAGRLASRQDHFFDSDLLDTQLDALEIPEYAWPIDVEGSPQEVVDVILERIRGTCTPETKSQSY